MERVESPAADICAILSRARCGGIHDFGDQLEEGSVEWRIGQPAPACLLLNDLELGSLPGGFGSHPSFSNVTELDLSGNRLRTLPSGIFTNLGMLRLLFLGGPGPKFTSQGDSCNMLESLPPLANLVHLEHLSLHDNNLKVLPNLLHCVLLRTLRVDRNPLCALPDLPNSLRVLHLEGCPMGGTLDHPECLPAQVRALTNLEDLQMPDGSHVGEFFGTPLGGLLSGAASGCLTDLDLNGNQAINSESMDRDIVLY
jgi:Leucine-rich repeat (LRR) protein